MKRRKKSVIVSIAIAMMLVMIAMGALRALPAKAGEAEGETLEFDLRDGYLRRTDSSGFIMQTILNSYRCGGEDVFLYDLDRDGTADVRISIWNKVFYDAHEVLTPVPGGSILGDYVLKATPERPLEYMTYENGPAVTHTVSSVVFHFPEEPVKAEYSLSGMGVAYFRDFTRDGERITKAAPGEIIYLLEDKKTGQYLKGWKTDSYPKDDLFYMHSNYYEDGTEADVAIAVREFIMPAHDVTMTPVYEKQQPYTIQVDGPNVIMAGDTELIADGIDCFIASLFNWDTSNIDTYTWYNMYTYYDLDGDGTDDICLGPYKSAHSLSICLFSDLTSYTLTAPNDGPYWPVTLTWKENNYTVDPSYIYYGSFSPRTGQKLYRSLKSYEVNGKTGFFDLDQDGSEDLFFEGIHFEYLSTCSIENSITIPGVPEGINHPVTFVVKEIPEEKSFHRVIVIKENEGDYYFNNSDWPRISDWFEEGTGVCLSPGEGYEFNSISINGSKVYLDDYARAFQYEFQVLNQDMIVRILFQTENGEIPGCHRVNVDGGFAYIETENGVEELLIGSYAGTGKKIVIYPETQYNGMVFDSWMVNGVDEYSIGEDSVLRFQMPDEDVTVRGRAKKSDACMTIDLTRGSYILISTLLDDVLYSLNLDRPWTSEDYDLNGDGIKDIRIDPVNSKIWPCEGYSCGETYQIFTHRGRFSSVIFIFPPEEKPIETPGNGDEPAEQKNTREEDGDSFKLLYVLISAEVLLIAGLTGLIIWRRKKKKNPPTKGEVVENKQEEKQE